MPAKILVLYYSTYGHIATLAKAVAEGAKSTGAEVDLYQVPETLPEEVLKKMYAAPKDASVPVLDHPEKLKEYDGFLFGIPTRYGRAPAQWSAFFDRTGGLWGSGALVGKFGGIFFSTAGQHGGQETTALTTLPFFAHHGIAYVPLGYQAPEISEMTELVGGSPWGAGTLSNGDGSRQVSAKELTVGKAQGTSFANIVGAYVKGKAATASETATSANRDLPASAAAATTAPTSNGSKPEESKPYNVDSSAPAAPAPDSSAATADGTAQDKEAKTTATGQNEKSQKKGIKDTLFGMCCGGKQENYS